MTKKSFFDLPDPDRIAPERPDVALAEDKHVATLKAMEKYSKPMQKGLDDLKIEHAVNRQAKLCLCLLPQWDPSFPPYSLAKLTSASRRAGYQVKAFDLNVEAYYDFKQNKWDCGFDPWDPVRDWHWINEHYKQDLAEHLEPIIDRVLDQIEQYNPDVIGCTLYYTNLQPTLQFVERAKHRMPDIKVVVGGPATHASFFKGHPLFDYAVNGEGEQALLALLGSIEANKKIEYTEQIDSKIIRQPENQRYNLSTLPMPDYSDYDFYKYKFPNGALCEISRGCIAKCTFCEETHFWKYRQRTALSTLTEVENMYYDYGTNVFWFIDSLVNGNLNELRAFCKGVAEKDMKIHWTGYCRCDGRMDLDYFKDLKAGGCSVLNYGIESGSQIVLDAMDKKVTVAEMEQNLKDGHSVGIEAMTNWIVGFPNEGPKEFEDTLSFLWRNRNYGISYIAQGTGFSVGVDTIVGQNLDKFNISPFYYYGHWITKDFRASIVHKLIKMKTFSIFCDLLPTEQFCSKPTRNALKTFHYQINFLDDRVQNSIEYDYDDFNYNIIHTGKGDFADSLVNEIWPFLRILWRARGGYKLTLKFRKDWEYAEWGERNAAPFNAIYYFDIDNAGNWKADFDIEFEQDEYNEWQDSHWYHNGEKIISPDVWSPVWSLMNFYQNNSNSAIRSRKLAWKGDATKKDKDPFNAFDEEEFFQHQQEFLTIREIDLSFKHRFVGKGKWIK